MSDVRNPQPSPAWRLRVGIALACSVSVAALLFAADFGDRGRHFDTRRALASNVLPGADPTSDLARLRILTRCIGFVRTNYVDPTRANAADMLVAALEQVERKVPELISEASRDASGRATSVRIRVGGDDRNFDITKVSDLYTMSWKMLDIFGFVAPELAGSTVDPKLVEYAAINGMLRTLDPHSVLLTPSVYQDMKMGTTGQFGGLGIVLGAKDGRLVIESVMDGTPASRAGLESGDVIVQVEGESTMNMSLSDAVERLRGAPGTSVTIWIDRKGFTQPRKYRIERENITLASVTSQRLEASLGYARIKNFQQSTSDDLKAAIERMSAEQLQETGTGLHGLVLDLRDNPGGLLDQAIEVSDLLLSDGVIVTTVGSGNKVREERVATKGGTYGDLPVVLLVNGGSASASEIVAGALRNNDRALLVGQRTFGKGSVQVLYDIDDVALKLTIAQYLTPGDESIQSVGITPHVELVPVSISREWVQLVVDGRDGERTLENHLENGERVKHHEPDSRVHFLVTDDDFTVEFARRVLFEAGRVKASEMLDKGAAIFAAADREQETRIVEALGKLDVDWNAGPVPARPKLDVKLELVAEPKFDAGDSVSLVVSVTNLGKAPVSRLHAVTESPLSALSGIELPIGRVPAGETRRWTTKATVPIETLSQFVPVRVRLWSDDTAVGELERPHGRMESDIPTPAAEAWLTVRGFDRPHFSYSVTVDDAKSNGDGIINENEKVELVVRIHNDGPGAARKSLATVKNRGGEEVFITDGRAWIDGIPAGGEAVVRFRVETKTGVPESGLELDLQVTDTELEERLTHTLPLPFARTPGEAFVKTPGRFATGAAVTRVLAAATDTAATLAELPPRTGFVSDGHVGPYQRVDFEGGGHGWVSRDGLIAPGDTVLATIPVRSVPTIRAPVLELAAVPVLSTTEATFVVAGRANFPSIDADERPDVYVFHDEDKVYFERTAEVRKASLDFRTGVSLHPGLNEVVIYARAGRDLGSKTRLMVYRK